MKIISGIMVVDDFDPTIQAKLDLIDKKVCVSKTHTDKFWVGTFVDNQYAPGRGLRPKRDVSETAFFNTVEEAADAACNPDKYNCKWGKG